MLRALAGNETRAVSGLLPDLPSRWNTISGYSGSASVDTALKVSAVWACVRLVADALAAAPLDVYSMRSGTKENVTTPITLARPDPQLTQHEWMFSLVSSLMLTGNAYAVWQDVRGGWPSGLTLVDPSLVVYVKDANGRLIAYKIGGKLFDPSLVLHIKAFTMPGRIGGISPLTQFGQTIGMGERAERFGYQFFTDGGVPTGILYSADDLTKDQATAIKTSWMDALRARREVAVVSAKLKYEKISVAPNESQFIESQHFTIEQICRIFGVPPEMIGHASSGSSVTYANIEERQLGFQTWTLLPWASRIETALTTVIPRPQFVKLNLDSMVRVSLLDRYKAHSMALRDGWSNPDERRALEDLGKIPRGDEYLWPVLPKLANTGTEAPADPTAADQNAPLATVGGK